MTKLIIIVLAILLLQVGLFILSRRVRKKQKENDVIEKYNIKSAKDAWNLIGDHSIPEEDRKKIEKLYHGENG